MDTDIRYILLRALELILGIVESLVPLACFLFGLWMSERKHYKKMKRLVKELIKKEKEGDACR
jgi:hypothetical protein